MGADFKEFKAGGKDYVAEQFGDTAPWEVDFEAFKIQGNNVDDVITAVRLAANAMQAGEDPDSLEYFFAAVPGIEAKKKA